MSDFLDLYRQKVADTNIDPSTLLSTDYFNTFNSVIMLLDMVPDTPELLEEILQWDFYDYKAHFKAGALDFSALAIEAYDHVPPETRAAFERLIDSMRLCVETARPVLQRLQAEGAADSFAQEAFQTAEFLREGVAQGNALVHGQTGSAEQAAIDALFP